MSKNDDLDDTYYAAIGRRVEAEQKAAAEKTKQEATERAADERLKKLIAEALETDRRRQNIESKKKVDRAIQVGLVGAAIFGSVAFITTLVEDDGEV
jgi:hypothetical protein